MRKSVLHASIFLLGDQILPQFSTDPQFSKMAEGYHPDRSQVSPDSLATFLRSPITGDLSEIPGVGPAAIERFAECEPPITTTWQLFGKFLMLKGEGVESVDHCDRFWFFLKSAGVTSHRAGIVRCIAEKCDTMFPGTYDPSRF